MRATKASALWAAIASVTIGGLSTYGTGHVSYMLVGAAAGLASVGSVAWLRRNSSE